MSAPARTAMAEENEQHLMAKFSDAFDGIEKSSSQIPLQAQFKELKILLEKKLSSSPPADELKSLREKLHYLNKVLTKCQKLSEKRRVSFLDDRWFLSNTKRNLNKIIRELGGKREGAVAPNATASSQGNNSESSFLSNIVEISRWTTSRPVDGSKIYGFDEEVMQLERLLLLRGSDDGFKAIGIVGMRGVGKTTLAQLIFNKQEVKKQFLPRIWVCLSKQPNEKQDARIEIAERMLVCLGVEEEMIESVFEKHGLPGLLFALHLQLNGKKYLIVLDDAWNSHGLDDKLDSWLSQEEKKGENLPCGLPKGYGGRVIVTTRTEEVARKMVGEENIYPLLPLSDQESCWSIFRDAVQKDEISPPNLETLKEEIKQKCAGLPLAAKMMGQIMHEQLREGAADNEINQNNSQQI